MPDIEEMTITEAERCPWLPLPAWRRGRNATVVKYTAETFVLKVSDHSEKVSLNSFSFSSDAFWLSGSFLGPAMPALVIKRLI